MNDDTNEPSSAARAADTNTDVQGAVKTANDGIADLGGRLKNSWERSNILRTSVGLVEDVIRTAPLAALGVAFIFGVMFAAGRRR